jgi:hypothetical protein
VRISGPSAFPGTTRLLAPHHRTRARLARSLGTTGNPGPPTPSPRFLTAALSRPLHPTDSTCQTSIARQNRNPRPPRFQADPRVARPDPHQPRLRSHAHLAIVRPDPHQPYSRFHTDNRGFVLRVSGLDRAAMASFRTATVSPAAQSTAGSAAMASFPPFGITGPPPPAIGRGRCMEPSGAA